jgi:hypothetical protein
MPHNLFVPIGTIIKRLSVHKVLVELKENIALGDIIHYNVPAKNTLCAVTHLENDQGEKVYSAKAGEKVFLHSTCSFLEGNELEKLNQIDCVRLKATINPQDICFLNGIIEGYDDVGVLRTLDSAQGLVEILASPCYQEEIYHLLHSLHDEMPHKIESFGGMRI